jgi:hypothetical protein
MLLSQQHGIEERDSNKEAVDKEEGICQWILLIN